ncbi:hypothetical protein [Snodgrassella sp. CFCC 13594]|uniref:hypothetical protein n=1 Tax=Snodgrassella sp. CFCC 13594 TaxID=1775559 RepID=UPI000830DBD4|nr:hypothetical protein [Snodgrassella sp. CFCC 13594]
MREQQPKNSAQPNAPKRSVVKKGLSSFTKIMLALLLLLAVAMAAFVFNAWQQLNRINLIDGQAASGASIEVLTPSGEAPTQNANGSIFVPQTNPEAASATVTAASAEQPTNTVTTAKPSKPAKAEQQPNTETPILPTNTGDNSAQSTAPQPTQHKPKSNLDDLF